MVSQLPASRSPTPYVPDLRQGQHVLLLGTTGSGKTTLAEAFLSRQPFVFVIDTKHELKWRAFQEVTRLTDALLSPAKSIPNRYIFRPRNAREAGAAIDALYQQGGWTILVDEVYGLSVRGSSSSYPEPYIRALTRGRSRGITVWSGMQRPRFAPYAAFTEASHYFIFLLQHLEDRKHVASFSVPFFRDYEPAKRYFAYYDTATRTVRESRPLRKEVR